MVKSRKHCNNVIRKFTILIALLLTGCAAKPMPDPASGINRATGRIHARAESIGEQAAQIESAPIGTPIESVKPLATSIRTQAGWIVVDVGEADNHVDQLNATIQRQRDEYTKLNGKWYVRVGKWVERALWTLAIGYVVAGLLAIALPLRWPVMGLSISKSIVRLVPAMNWASFIRDRLIGRKAGK